MGLQRVRHNWTISKLSNLMEVFLKLLHIQRATLLNHCSTQNSQSRLLLTISSPVLPGTLGDTAFFFSRFFSQAADTHFTMNADLIGGSKRKFSDENLDSYSFLRQFWNVNSCRCHMVSWYPRTKSPVLPCFSNDIKTAAWPALIIRPHLL